MIDATNKIENPIVEIPKPWGKEVVWAITQQYAGKLLFFKAGGQTSLHYHDKRDKTIFLIGGTARLYLAELDGSTDHECDMSPGHYYHIPIGLATRINAITDCIVLECSTSHLDDVVRLDDVYGRIPATDSPTSSDFIQSV